MMSGLSFKNIPIKKLENFKDHITHIQLEVLDWVPEVLKCVQQLSRSLFALHQNLHFHLGISWENLYVDSNGQFTLLGFGMGSRLTSQSRGVVSTGNTYRLPTIRSR